MNTLRANEYRVGQRSVLRPGTRFRATGGPLFRLANGTEVRLAAKGPFTFKAWVKQGGCEIIEALDRDGCFAPLHIAGHRHQSVPEIIPRPYRIKSTIRKKERR